MVSLPEADGPAKVRQAGVNSHACARSDGEGICLRYQVSGVFENGLIDWGHGMHRWNEAWQPKYSS